MSVATENSIREAVEAVFEETVAQRRDFHMHPEVAFEEFRTSGIIADKLAALGLDVRRGPSGRRSGRGCAITKRAIFCGRCSTATGC